MSDSIQKFWQTAKNSKLFTRALPFAIFVVGGSFFLQQFSTLRYEFRKGKKLSQEEATAMGLQLKDVNVAQKEILKEIEKEEADSWYNIRGPRPWEDSKTIQDIQRNPTDQTSGLITCLAKYLDPEKNPPRKAGPTL